MLTVSAGISFRSTSACGEGTGSAMAFVCTASTGEVVEVVEACDVVVLFPFVTEVPLTASVLFSCLDELSASDKELFSLDWGSSVAGVATIVVPLVSGCAFSVVEALFSADCCSACLLF